LSEKFYLFAIAAPANEGREGGSILKSGPLSRRPTKDAVRHCSRSISLAFTAIESGPANSVFTCQRSERGMIDRNFFKAGHWPTLFAAFFYFDMSFMVWILLGPLAVQISNDLHLDPAQKGLMVALPVLAGAVLRVANGVLVDRLAPRRAGVIGQILVILGLLTFWYFGVHSYAQVLLLGVILGVAGASFAVALPLASRWALPARAIPAPSWRRFSRRCSPRPSAGTMSLAWPRCR